MVLAPTDSHQITLLANNPALLFLLQVLQKICWYVVLAPTDSHQITLLANTLADKRLDELKPYKELLQQFENKEVGAAEAVHPAYCEAYQRQAWWVLQSNRCTQWYPRAAAGSPCGDKEAAPVFGKCATWARLQQAGH